MARCAQRLPYHKHREPRVRMARYFRPLIACFRMPGSGTFSVLLGIFVVTVFASVLIIRFQYVDEETGHRCDWGEAIYVVMALLVFESPIAFPSSWIARISFFAVPLSGLLVFGQGLLRLWKSLSDKNTWDLAMASTYQNHSIVCGLGKIGLRVTRWILDLKEEAVVIESDGNNPLIPQVREWGVPVVIGDAKRLEVLRSVGIDRAESIVPCTSDDLANLAIALEARSVCPGIKVVLRMYDQQMANNVRSGFDINRTYSIPEIAAPPLAAAATRVPLDHAFTYGEGDERSLITITKFALVVESVLIGYSVGQMEEEFKVAVIGIRKNGKFELHPARSTILECDDRFVVSAGIDSLNLLAGLTPPANELERYRKGRWPLQRTRARS
ncbi:MAG: NAD-binding protein [Verrucomicrobia bacterium]|nr:NAD-binding protein [Verrucomicrobiota bacterium]